LDKNLPGPDHRLSADVAEMKFLVTAVREIEQALKANGKAEITARELKERGLARRSVTANRVIERGEIIQASACELKRPGLGIPPDEARFLWGRRAATRIEKDHWLTWEMVE
jgi:sialic acid synthase SpsE